MKKITDETTLCELALQLGVMGCSNLDYRILHGRSIVSATCSRNVTVIGRGESFAEAVNSTLEQAAELERDDLQRWYAMQRP